MDPIQVNATVVAAMSYPKARVTYVQVSVPIADSVEFLFTPKGTCTQNVVTNTAFDGAATVSASNNCARNAFQSTRITEGGVTKLMISTNASASVFRAAVQPAPQPQVFFEVNAIYRLVLPPDLVITHIYPVQAVQTPQEFVTLIGRKQTAVRVFIRSLGPSAAPVPNVTAQLRLSGRPESPEVRNDAGNGADYGHATREYARS